MNWLVNTLPQYPYWHHGTDTEWLQTEDRQTLRRLSVEAGLLSRALQHFCQLRDFGGSIAFSANHMLLTRHLGVSISDLGWMCRHFVRTTSQKLRLALLLIAWGSIIINEVPFMSIVKYRSSLSLTQ